MTESNEDLLAELAHEVRQDPPRLFAICGVYRGEGEPSAFVRWGFELPDQSRAVAWAGGLTTESNSAEQMLKHCGRFGDARLVWLP